MFLHFRWRFDLRDESWRLTGDRGCRAQPLDKRTGPQAFERLQDSESPRHCGTMIDITLLRTSRLEHAIPGSLFIPVVENGSHFLSGRINDYPVLVELDGEEPFRFAKTEAWSKTSGLVIESGRFQVESRSAVPVQSARDAPPGSLVLAREGPTLIAHDENGPQSVRLGGGEGPTELELGDVAFTQWQFVTGTEPDLAVHFQHPQKPE